MFCANCGKEVSKEASFCSHCGNAIKPTSAEPIGTSNNEITSNTYMTTQQAVQLRSLFARLGHKIPDNEIGRNYNEYFQKVDLAPMNVGEESVIIHLGIRKVVSNRNTWDKLGARAIKSVSREGRTLWKYKKGEIVVTNQRIIVLSGLGIFGTPSGISIDISNFERVEEIEFSGFVQFTFYGKNSEDVVLEMNFTNVGAILGRMFQAASAVTNKKPSNWIDYLEQKESQQGLQNYINAHLMQADTVKQAFSEVIKLLVDVNS